MKRAKQLADVFSQAAKTHRTTQLAVSIGSTGPLAAKGLINVKSANAHIDWAAATKITLSVEGGAQVVISAEGVFPQCPGKMTVHAAQKRFLGPDGAEYALPALPRSICVSCLLSARATGSPFSLR